MAKRKITAVPTSFPIEVIDKEELAAIAERDRLRNSSLNRYAVLRAFISSEISDQQGQLGTFQRGITEGSFGAWENALEATFHAAYLEVLTRYQKGIEARDQRNYTPQTEELAADLLADMLEQSIEEALRAAKLRGTSTNQGANQYAQAEAVGKARMADILRLLFKHGELHKWML